MLALPLAFGEARFAACLRAAPGPTRLVAFFLLAFRLGRFVDFFAELLAFRFPFAFTLPRAAAFFRVAFFFAAMGVWFPSFDSIFPQSLREKLSQSACV